jgi:hypothetical protein
MESNEQEHEQEYTRLDEDTLVLVQALDKLVNMFIEALRPAIYNMSKRDDNS